MKNHFDVLVIGTGAAGLYGALHISPEMSVLSVCKGEILLSNSDLAQGGIAAVTLEEDKYENCHLYFENCHNLALSGNTFLTGRDDFGDTPFSPDYGIVYKKLRSCSFTGNTMYGGAMIEKLCDLGDNCDNAFCGNAGTNPPDKNEKPGNGSYE